MRCARPGLAGAEAVPLWHGDADLHGVDAVVLPGGFSYGDYLRAGAIARFSPVVAEIVAAAGRGCRCSASATASRCCARRTCCPGRSSATPACTSSAATSSCGSRTPAPPGPASTPTAQQIVIPVKHGEGRYVADAATLDELEAHGQVVVRYVGGNPNGSLTTSPASATTPATSSG